jgi:glycosyltransferase involved in cell wall biosynthesis
MRIGIDARKIRDFGIGTHIANLIRYIPEFDTKNEYYIFHYPADKDYVPCTGLNIRLVPDMSPKYSLRELVVLPFKMGQLRLDLFHATHYTLPPIRPCQGVVTIHDVIHLKFPEYLPHPAAYYYAKGMMWAAAHSAHKVITVSECSKRDIVQYLGVPEQKVAVVYNGVDSPLVPLSVADATKRGNESLNPLSFLKRGGQGVIFPYILYLGNFLPHKNLDTLIKAYSLLKRQYKVDHALVLAGKNDRMKPLLQKLMAAEKLAHDVILTGFVEPEWMPALYMHADLFVYPSLYEGFGLQALEAMAYQIPVAISNVSSLPEIAGDAAIQFDPISPENMAEVIHQALTDQALRTSLIAKGQQRLKIFSWREMARKTVDIYQCESCTTS